MIKIITKCLGLLLVLSSAPVNAQLLQDTAVLNLVKEDIDYIYNLQFNNAREVYTKIIRSYPGHPIVYLLRGLITYWEDYPILPSSAARHSFTEDMKQCIRLSEKNDNPAYEAEYLLADLCAKGMLLTYFEDNDLILEVIPLTINSYKKVRRSFDFTSACTDLYYFTGLYNYYREAYPKIYPEYKSLAMLFPPGNMLTGLKQIQTAAFNSVVLSAEAYTLLIWIYLNFENKPDESLYYCRLFHEKYPQNILNLCTYIRNLLYMKKYDEAEKMLASSSADVKNKYYQAQLIILKGILQEKKYFDYTLAQQYYNTGISEISLYGDYANEYEAYAFFGLSRISRAQGEKQMYKIYRKEALKLADFKKINFDR